MMMQTDSASSLLFRSLVPHFPPLLVFLKDKNLAPTCCNILSQSGYSMGAVSLRLETIFYH